ncbi:MAG: alkaline phosphatase PhoX [Ilumatobacteraceae bacterium]
MALSRRDIIRNTAIGAGVVAVGNVDVLFGAGRAHADGAGAEHGNGGSSAPYGDLVPDPAGILDLPKGFSYEIVSQAGERLINGKPLPDRFDGTGTFAGPLKSVFIVRNHEQYESAPIPCIDSARPAFVYDNGVYAATGEYAANGGTSTVVLDRRNHKVLEYVSLAGTYSNCAGGETPWGTWLTCEETELVPGPTNGATKTHGWVFEVDPYSPLHNARPTPLEALGRFAHEAAVVDPRTGSVYLTEDSSKPNGLVYKCEPADPRPGYGRLRAGGSLFAMRCTEGGAAVPDLSVYTEIGTTLAVEWVAVPDPAAMTMGSTRKQFDFLDFAANAVVAGVSGDAITRSRKFEGAWYDGGKIFIVCSFAHGAGDWSLGSHDGQVWSLDPSDETLTLEVRFDVNVDPAGAGTDLPDGPDNITVSPWGGVILCEDGEGVQHLLAVAPDGSTSLFARNHENDSEFTGACFSPDRKTLFANRQEPGITFAITGPFAKVNRAR